MQQRHHWFLLGAAGLCLTGCATSRPFHTDDIPESLRAPANRLLTVQAHAKGVQIYQCRPVKDDATRFEWVLVAPEANLYDGSGKKLGRHYAGPSWQSTDGSVVVGQVAAKATSPDGHSIPWLLLTAKTTSGNGVFSNVASVQRVHTAGGDAPGSCSDQQTGKELRVDYTADYFFYVGAG